MAQHDDLVGRLRRTADTLPPPGDVRQRATEVGLGLGLPHAWLTALPDIGLLPGEHGGGRGAERYGADASLTRAALEHKARTGRLHDMRPDEADLVAEALEDASRRDGMDWLLDAIEDVMFSVAWPRRTYSLHVDLQTAAERMLGCLRASPSSLLFADAGGIESCWQLAAHRIHALDPEIAPPETSPWPDFAAVLRAAAERIAEGCEMERRWAHGEPVPEPYRSFYS